MREEEFAARIQEVARGRAARDVRDLELDLLWESLVGLDDRLDDMVTYSSERDVDGVDLDETDRWDEYLDWYKWEFERSAADRFDRRAEEEESEAVLHGVARRGGE